MSRSAVAVTQVTGVGPLEFRLDQTGLLVVDPYTDFISEGGKLWPRVREVAEANGCVPHMIEILDATRTAGVRIFFAPHRRWRSGDYNETWKFWAPIQESAARAKVFADGTGGGTFRDELTPRPGEVVALEHWCSSGFANTDLDVQLKKHGIHQLIVIGMRANTCIDSTVRYAADCDRQLQPGRNEGDSRAQRAQLRTDDCLDEGAGGLDPATPFSRRCAAARPARGTR